MTRVLIGTDGSDEAIAAAERAMSVLATPDQLTIVCVVEPPPAATAGLESGFSGGVADPQTIDAAWAEARDEATAALERTAAAISTTANIELRAERFVLLEHGVRMWGPSLVVTDSTGGRHALLRARRVELVTSWYGLVLGRPDALEIELDHPIVLLKRDASGRFILPRFRSTRREPRPESKVLLDLRPRLLFSLLERHAGRLVAGRVSGFVSRL